MGYEVDQSVPDLVAMFEADQQLSAALKRLRRIATESSAIRPTLSSVARLELIFKLLTRRETPKRGEQDEEEFLAIEVQCGGSVVRLSCCAH